MQVLSAAEGLHTQTKSTQVQCISQLLRTEKRFTLSDEITLSDAQPALLAVIRTQTVLSFSETRVVAGKLVVKGEANVSLLYTSSDGIESLNAVLPFSQIVEQDGMSDEMPVMVTALLSEQSMTPEAENNGDIRLLHCDLQIILQCAALRTANAELLTDLYSTVHPAEPLRQEITWLTAPVQISEHLQQKLTLTQPDAVLTRVYAVWCMPENMQTAEDSGGTVLHGTLHSCVLAADAEDQPLMLETRTDFSWPLPQIAAWAELPPLTVASCTYTLAGSDTVAVQAELKLSGQIMQQKTLTLLTDVSADAEARLYFAQPEESLWEIAKRYHTAESAIREENDISGETLAERRMLLIPIVQ